jgi:hypothetical protein
MNMTSPFMIWDIEQQFHSGRIDPADQVHVIAEGTR